MPVPQIAYFDIRGRVEAIRLLLEEVGAEYEDWRVTDEEWIELRPTTPFGQLPRYRDGELEIFQAFAICSHLARVHGLDGRSEAQRTRCEVVLEAIRDVYLPIGPLIWSPDFENERRRFVSGALPERLQALERFLLAESAEPEFWAGDSLTLADFRGFTLLDDMQGLFPRSLDATPALAAMKDRFAARPRIAAYLASPRRPVAIMNGPMGKVLPAS